MKKLYVLVFACAAILAACTDAQIASNNLSKAAEQFRIDRRIVFINVMTGEYILSVEGRCSIEDLGTKVAITCKVGPDGYKKHQMGRTETVTYFSEQLGIVNVDVYHYKVIFKPAAILPDIDLVTE